ncbi:hypothetical protein ACFY9N_03000 [Microbacterium sp. NPDC008134]|uniref:hypothetical protein n=1 Tax=Microbacterium sp. NPDC008134 TaxID=3364183 RepID=UPI0036E083F5
MSRRAKAVVIVSAFAFVLLAACGVAAMLNLGRSLGAADVAGSWRFESEGHSIEIRVDADGGFTAPRWPENLGCSNAPWPSRVADVTWERTVRFEGSWSVDDITGRAINLYGDPSGDCSIVTLNASPVLGDNSLSVTLDLTGEPVELTFSRR